MATLKNKYYGIGLNFGKSINGFFSTSADKKLVKENMKAILLTNPGERVHLPDFGVGLRRYLFEMNDAQLATVIREKIIQQINKYEPLADVMDIQFKQVGNQMNIRILYRLKDVGGETGVLEITEQQTI
jgi:phage baseplate assembly protein W